MDKTEELQKYKALLDAGAITQEEFTRLKQRLLGLEPPAAADEKQAARAAALAEIEQMRQKQAAGAQAPAAPDRAAVAAQARKEAEARYREEYRTEKAKESARLAAAAEAKAQEQARRQAARQETAGKVWRFAKLLLKWVLTVFLALLGMGSLLMVDTGIRYLFTGILELLLAAMACPPLTAKTRDIGALAAYYRFKAPIAVVLTVVMLLVMTFVP